VWLTDKTGARQGPVAAAVVRERKRERDRASVGHRHAGPGGIAPSGAVQTRFETKFQIQIVQNIFKPFENMVLKLSKTETTFSLEISSDSEWIWN
jgi:hypothetical protein